MKKVVSNLIIATVTGMIATSATSAFAQANGLITIDENGKGNFNGTPLTFTVAPDPFSGLATLSYNLPFPGTPGDVLLMEPTGILSDIVRFDGQGHLFFFSERETSDVPPFDLADVTQFPGSLPAAIGPTVSFLEVGPEGNNGLLYTPNAGDPGYGPVPSAWSYNIISDAVVVPEPNASLLASLGGFFGALGLEVATDVQPQVKTVTTIKQ